MEQTNKILINVNIYDIFDALQNLNKNNKYLLIKNNLFSINRIFTMINIKKQNLNLSFNFSYDNLNVEINTELINDRCSSFIQNCQLISDEEAKSLLEKASNIYKKKIEDETEDLNIDHTLTERIFRAENEIDNIFYNEVLVYISSKINENDKDSTKDDFISKYNLFKKNVAEKNAELTLKFELLYKNLISIKINGTLIENDYR